MEYDKYVVTEAEYEKIRVQHLVCETKRDQICYIKELNKLYKFRHLTSNGMVIIESKIVNGKEELVNSKIYIDEKLTAENCYDEDIRIEKRYNYLRMQGMGMVIRYYKNDKLHRTDGPAIEYKNRDCEGYYYINGNSIDDKFFKKITRNIRNGNVIHILDNYDYDDLMIIKMMIEEIGDEKQLEVVNKYLIVRMLEDESK